MWENRKVDYKDKIKMAWRMRRREMRGLIVATVGGWIMN